MANSKLDVIDPETTPLMTYESSIRSGAHGDVYQKQIAQLILLRLTRERRDFRLAYELTSADKFDDVVVYDNKAKQWIFLQSKHVDGKDSKIDLNGLLPKANRAKGDFSLYKYFTSYMLIRSRFKGELKFLLFTNKKLDEKLKTAGDHLSIEDRDVDGYLRFTYEGATHKLLTPTESTVQSIVEYVNNDFYSLKDAIKQLFTEGIVRDELFKYKAHLNDILVKSGKHQIRFKKTFNDSLIFIAKLYKVLLSELPNIKPIDKPPEFVVEETEYEYSSYPSVEDQDFEHLIDGMKDLFRSGIVSDHLKQYKNLLALILTTTESGQLALKDKYNCDIFWKAELYRMLKAELSDMHKNVTTKLFDGKDSRIEPHPVLYADASDVRHFFALLTLSVHQPDELEPFIVEELHLWIRTWLRPDVLGRLTGDDDKNAVHDLDGYFDATLKCEQGNAKRYLNQEFVTEYCNKLRTNIEERHSEIKRAFRTMSVLLHPDKNDAEDANIKFRNMVAVYEVLKDAGKREKYDKVLKEGMPNWKSALYYYRRMRKVGLAEGLAIVMLIISVIQYATAWAAYAEKKYTAEQIFGSKLKKLQKKNKTNVDMDTILSEIPTPSIWNILPFQIPVWTYKTITGTPGAIKSAMNFYAEQKKAEEARKQMEKEEEELLRKQEEERAKLKEDRNLRKRNKKFVAPEKTDEELAAYTQSIIQPSANDTNKAKPKPVVTGGLWTEDDLMELIRLVKKYPGGTTDRWEIIAEMMGRAVAEVTHMAAKMKETAFKVPGQTESVAETIIQEATKQKIKTKKTEPTAAAAAESSSNWSQTQQAALETAIQKYPKSGSSDRWQKIAGCVPGKTKEECMTRYKYLVELVKKQKEEKEREASAAAAAAPEEPQECPATEEPSCEERIEEPKSKAKGKKAKKQEASAVAAEEADDDAADKQKGGKAKNKRRERKKAIEYYSYEDSDGEDGTGSEPGEI
ncbi:hypothetical protein RP20_CCG017031 [Aedes albopictus]|nr:hypothetical protein RP20_CCG017031 [Aedes albopictus]